jgi:hypothetical protein
MTRRLAESYRWDKAEHFHDAITARDSNGENGWPLRNVIHSASGKLEIVGAWDK